MSPTELLLVQSLVGQVLPPLTDVVNKNFHNPKVRFLISMGISAGVGLLFNATNLKFSNWEQILTSMLVLFTSSQAAYKFYYGDSVWQNRIRFTDSILPVKEVLIPPIDLPKLRK